MIKTIVYRYTTDYFKVYGANMFSDSEAYFFYPLGQISEKVSYLTPYKIGNSQAFIHT